MFGKISRFFMNVGGLIKAIMGAAVLVIIGVVLEDTVLPAIITNTDPGTIGATVLPLLRAGILIACILTAVAVIYYAATHAFSGK